jgi:predicted phage tail protein
MADVVYRRSPLAEQLPVQAVQPGTRVADILPAWVGPYVCVFNDQPLLRAEWQTRRIHEGDTCFFIPLMQGGGGGEKNPLAIVLQVGLLVATAGLSAAAQTAFTAGSLAAGIGYTALTVGVSLAGSALINAVVGPPRQPAALTNQQINSPSSTYSVALAGNRARLGQPLPVIYGRMKVFPDFVCQPWTYFDASNNAFFEAVYCVGRGSYEVEGAYFDDTPIASFSDITLTFYAPGSTGFTALDVFRGVTAQEVSGIEVDDLTARGPFVVSAPEQDIDRVYVDVVFPRGLFFANSDGTLGNKTVTWDVHAEPIDDFGVSTGAAILLGSESVTAASATPLRKSYTYTLATPGRYQIRLTRTSAFDTNSRAANSLSWVGLRGRLVPVAGAPVPPAATYLHLVMRASNQLNGQISQRLGLIVQRQIAEYAIGSGWSAPRRSRSIIWALADAVRNAEYGPALPDARLDLDDLAAVASTLDARKDRFDAIFDGAQTVYEVISQIARAGRAVPVLTFNRLTVVRDEQRSVPVALFTPRNITRDSLQMEYLLPTGDSADGLQVEYWDQIAWGPRTFTVPAPGVTTPLRPAPFRAFGMTQRAQAEREARYAIAASAYRRKILTLGTEMDGLSLRYGDPARIAHDLPGWGSSGEIVELLDLGGGSYRFTLSEPIPYAVNATVRFQWTSKRGIPQSGDNGQAQVETEYTVLMQNPTLLPALEDDVERARYSIGQLTGTDYAQDVRIVSIRPRSDQQVELVMVGEDTRVHTADAGIEVEDLPGTGAPATNQTVTIAAVNPYEVRLTLLDRYIAQFGTPTGPVSVEYIIQPGVKIVTDSLTVPALTLGVHPSGSTIVLRNEGQVTGKPGGGGNGGVSGNNPATAGLSGGPACLLDSPGSDVYLVNGLGRLLGGGGGGGGGGPGARNIGNVIALDGGGGGGGGHAQIIKPFVEALDAPGGLAGDGGTDGEPGGPSDSSTTTGPAPGLGGDGAAPQATTFQQAGRGGDGGEYGQTGDPGSGTNGAPGGAPGYAYRVTTGTNLITVGAVGDVRGPILTS